LKTKDINLNQPLSFSNQATLGGVKGAKQALALVLDTIRVTDTIFEVLGKYEIMSNIKKV
jgi:hypothetical protein